MQNSSCGPGGRPLRVATSLNQTSGIFLLIFRTLLLAFLLLFGLALQPASAQDMNIQSKYGLLPKNDAHKAADAKFIAMVEDYYKGDRKKGAEDV